MGYKKMYYKRGVYEIRVFEEVTGFLHIAINRKDRKPITATWDVLYAIKNEAVGEDGYAVEVYPDKTCLVYEENMRHLFVFPEGDRLPLGPRWSPGSA